MASIILLTKPLSVNPLKVSSRVGAALAFLGLARCMPLEHGVRGCAAFTKLFFMRHFREPIALQTTAVNEVATIVGSDENVIEALHTIIERSKPELIGLTASALSEFQGTDMRQTLSDFRRQYPAHSQIAVIPVVDFEGIDGLEGGYARAVEAIIDTLVPETRTAGSRPAQVNILASSLLTPGDIDNLKTWVSDFGLQATMLPDLADSLDGHLLDEGFQPLTYGGASRAAIEQMGKAVATIMLGSSLWPAADLLKARTGVPDFRFNSLMGVAACDELTGLLARLSKRPVSDRLRRQRSRLLDAMVDCQFYTAGASASVAGEHDTLFAMQPFLAESGIAIDRMIAATPARSLAESGPSNITVGDLDDLRSSLMAGKSDLMLANSHALGLSNELGVPLLRVGFPQHDFIGAHAKVWIGYDGTRQTLFDVSNLLAQFRRQNQPYHSIYKSNTTATIGKSDLVSLRGNAQ